MSLLETIGLGAGAAGVGAGLAIGGHGDDIKKYTIAILAIAGMYIILTGKIKI